MSTAPDESAVTLRWDSDPTWTRTVEPPRNPTAYTARPRAAESELQATVSASAVPP